MAQAAGRSSTRTPPPSPRTGRQGYPWAAGLVLFAGVMMVANGILSVFEGAVGVSKDTVYATTPNYVYKFDLTSWGWIHIALGAVVALIGLGVIAGRTWARYLGIFVVALSLFANFMFLPYYPLWAIIVIAIDVFVLWALCTYRRGDRYAGRGERLTGQGGGQGETWGGGRSAQGPGTGTGGRTDEPPGRGY